MKQYNQEEFHIGLDHSMFFLQYFNKELLKLVQLCLDQHFVLKIINKQYKNQQMKQEQLTKNAYYNPLDIVSQSPKYPRTFKNEITSAKYESSMSQQKMYVQQENQVCNFNQSQINLVKDLLQALEYNKTIQVFKKERKDNKDSRNPQKSAQKIKLIARQKEGLVKQNATNHNIQSIIRQSKSFQDMLASLTGVLAKENNKQDRMQQQNQDLYDKNSTSVNLERAIQQLFPQKQKFTIPIFKSLQIECENKEIKLIDIDIKENTCLLDSQNNIYIIKAQEQKKAISAKVEQKKGIIDMRWVNSQLIVLLTASNKIIFYDSLKLTNIKTIKNYKMAVLVHEIYINNKERLNQKQNLYILSVSQHKFMPIKISCKETEIILEGKYIFQQKYQLRAITMIKVPHKVTFQRNIISDLKPTQFTISTDIQHFYGLTKNEVSIVKFDTVVEESGIIWDAYPQTKIWELSSSNCNYFVNILLIRQQSKYDWESSSHIQLFGFMKMNGNGSIIQKIDFHLKNISKVIDYGLQYFSDVQILSKWNKLKPQWLRCYVYKNHIIYFSIRSGNIIYSQQIDGNGIKIRGVSSSNSIVYEANKKLIMLSTNQTKKRRIVLQSRKSHDYRETIIQRFSRLQGVPQNLLVLLRSIRNHDLQLMQIP